MVFQVVSHVNRNGPHYCLDWTPHGYDAVLNTVAIPEKSLQALGETK